MLLEKPGTVDQKMQFEIAEGCFRLHIKYSTLCFNNVFKSFG
jgi:hypothetical protein